MNEKERNERAWNDPANWIGPRWLGMYRASQDSRLFVPRKPRLAGLTINLAHPGARWFFVAIAALVAIAVGVQLLWRP
jgi:uncharacterized membrane protein